MNIFQRGVNMVKRPAFSEEKAINKDITWLLNT